MNDVARIAGLSLFAALDDDQRGHVAAIADEQQLPAGTVVFREGDPSEDVYVVAEGRVSLSMRVERRGETLILSVGPGELLGWTGFQSTGTRVATARTVEATTLVRLPSGPIRELCERDHDVGFALMKRAFAEVTRRLQETRMQLLDMFRGPEG
ncbi:MAG: cyclic nucleotide-binding domain-containing protein [Polyangiales bacterium]